MLELYLDIIFGTSLKERMYKRKFQFRKDQKFFFDQKTLAKLTKVDTPDEQKTIFVAEIIPKIKTVYYVILFNKVQ